MRSSQANVNQPTLVAATTTTTATTPTVSSQVQNTHAANLLQLSFNLFLFLAAALFLDCIAVSDNCVFMVAALLMVTLVALVAMVQAQKGLS